VKELKGFERVDLKAGESKNVTFTLDRDSFAYYSMAKHEWIAEPGKFEILVGASSRDIRSRATFDLAR
jgi:beta-glucosidase